MLFAFIMAQALHKILFLAVYLFGVSVCLAQTSDFISLKKRGRTIKNFYKGTFIEFVHKNGSHVYGTVDRVFKDSLYMVQHDVRMIPNRWGTQSADTVATYSMRFHYKDIVAFPKEPKGFEFIRNGTLFMIGGVAYAFLHTTNGLIQKQKIEPSVIAISGGVALIGLGMKKLRKYYYPLGRKYQLEYINLTSSE